MIAEKYLGGVYNKKMNPPEVLEKDKILDTLRGFKRGLEYSREFLEDLEGIRGHKIIKMLYSLIVSFEVFRGL